MYHVIYIYTYTYVYIYNSIYLTVRGTPVQVQNQVLALLQFGASDPWAWLAAGPSLGLGGPFWNPKSGVVVLNSSAHLDLPSGELT